MCDKSTNPDTKECIPVGCVLSAAVAVSPAMHIPAMHTPCHACPCMPPAMHAPCHAHTLSYMPLCHAHPLQCTSLHHACPLHAHPLSCTPLLNIGYISNETNTDVLMYIEEFILVEIWIQCCTKLK